MGMKRTVVYILVVSCALALWQLYLGDLYLDSVGSNDLPETGIFGVTMLGYGIVLSTATLISFVLTRGVKQ